MKNIIGILLTSILTVTVAFGQEKMTKTEKKEMKEKKQEEEKAQLEALVEAKKFVLEAQKLYDSNRNSYPMNSATNFVIIDGDKVTIQLSFAGLAGWNGLGGLTVDNTIDEYKIIPGKKAKSPVQLDLRTTGKTVGRITMFFTLNTGYANVRYSDMQGNQFSFDGQFRSFEDSSVMKGTAITN